MKISFAILTWNRYKFLDKCLAALIPAMGTQNTSEIIVMDNGSTDNTSVVLEQYTGNPSVKVVKRKKNYGMNAYKKTFWHGKGRIHSDCR